MKNGKNVEISNLRITISSFLCLLAAGILIVSFLPETSITEDVLEEEDFVSPYEGCPQNIANFHLPKKLIFMVIDAWRLDFLTFSNSPMKFLRNSLESGQAVGFEVYARTPTVTMPRITALLSGTLPSFGSVLTNFASPEMRVDNWLRQTKEKGKRINFYGDDTWLKLFPETFHDSEGVTSFYVNDFTEVDNNVTRHLATLVGENSKKWDVLILHYLGLDHIGHSLGGTSTQIPIKLQEMDGIVENLYGSLKDENALLVIVGDHGMTQQGGHGGASPEETKVPMVFVTTKFGIKGTQNGMPKAEQLDLSPTISFFLGLKNPGKSAGISLIPEIAKTWDIDELKVAKETSKTFHQLWRLSKEKSNLYPIRQEFFQANPEICGKTSQLIIWYQDEGEKMFRKIQNEILEDQSRFSAGWCIISMSLILTAFLLLNDGIPKVSELQLSHLVLLLPFLASLSSSLVEEEHEIWYYLTTTVLLIRAYQEKTRRKSYFFLVLLHRIGVGYTMDLRRRWIMDKEVLPKPIFEDPGFFFPITQLFDRFNAKRFFSSLSLPLTNLFVVLSIFPILKSQHTSSSKTIGSILLVCCRITRILDLTLTLYSFDVIATVFRLSCLYLLRHHSCFVLNLYLLFLSPAHLLPLNLVIWEIGEVAGQLELNFTEISMILWSCFYYAGTSTSLSSIDISPGYTGFQSYSPVPVATQITLNLYSPVLLFSIAYSSKKKFSREDAIALAKYRILLLLTALGSFVHFREHLFVWSVFGPKVVFELLHIITMILSFAISWIFRVFL